MIKDMEPGRYRTRNGKIAIVAQHRPSWVLPWHGAIEGCADCWGSNGEYVPGMEPNCKDLVARLPDDPDDRIQRALEIIQSVQTYHHFEGGWNGGGVLLPAKTNDGDWVEADIVNQLRKILEGESNEH